MLATAGPMDEQQGNSGPIAPADCSLRTTWIPVVVRSYVIADAVVRKLNLYPCGRTDPNDSTLFRGFALSDAGYAASEYELLVRPIAKAMDPVCVRQDGTRGRPSGAVTDSVGKRLGFQWVLPKGAFNSRRPAEGEVHRLDCSWRPRCRSASGWTLGVPSRPATSCWCRSRIRMEASRRESSNTVASRSISPSPRTLKKRKLVGFANTLDNPVAFGKGRPPIPAELLGPVVDIPDGRHHQAARGLPPMARRSPLERRIRGTHCSRATSTSSWSTTTSSTTSRRSMAFSRPSRTTACPKM